jgi:PAS domain S-box-containing protein
MIREKTKTILLVEDEAIIALAEEKILKRHGFTVITAYSGEEAGEIFLQSPEIDLVLMDINLGSGMDGTRAAEFILRHREIPLIFLSSHTEREVVEKTEGITSYGYIVKNSGEVVLIASIKMAFRLFEARMKEREKDAALRKSEERFALAMEAARDGLWDWDVAGGGVYYSPGYARMLAYAPEEIPADRGFWMGLIHPDDRDAALKANNDCVENVRDDFSIEFRMRARNGEWRWILGRGKAVARDGNGRAVRMVGTHVDITLLKTIEMALRENRELLRLFIEHAPAALAMFDRDMRYLAVSLRWKSDYGLGDADIIGRSHYEIFPELPNRWKEVHRRGMKGEAVRGAEECFERMDGSIQWLHWEMLPWRDADGAVGGIVIFSEDITDRVRIQEELRNEKRRLAERIKELNGLYGISRLIEEPGGTLEEMLQGTADLLPRAWQYPEIARARITLDGNRYTSQDFSEGKWRQAAEITVDGAGVGAVEVFYLQAGPECDEGPFLKEERSLINAVAARMGSLIELKRAEKALEEMTREKKTTPSA